MKEPQRAHCYCNKLSKQQTTKDKTTMITTASGKKYRYATRLNTVKRRLKGDRVLWRHDLSMRGTVIQVNGNKCTIKWDGVGFDEPRTVKGYTHYELMTLHAERDPEW